MNLIHEAENSHTDNDALDLGAPHISYLVSPIDGDEGYHGGLGAEALKEDLLVTVDLWLNNEFGQRCELFWKRRHHPRPHGDY